MAKKEKEKRDAGRTNAKQEPKQQKGSKAEEQERKGKPLLGPNIRVAIPVAVLIAAAFAIFFLVLVPSLSVPFSTFKSNYMSAARVAIVVSYTNTSVFAVESNCANKLIYVIAQHRNATTIDYYLMNQSTCTYPVGGLGHTLSIATNTTADCLSMIGSEPAVFLNTSASNITLIQPYRLYAHGNTAYFNKCPLAVDLS